MATKTLLIATFPMTPSVNELYANVTEETAGKSKRRGRVMKYEFRNLKEYIKTCLYNGFFIEGNVEKIYHIDQVTVRDIRELYDRAHFQKPKEPLEHKFTIALTFVFTNAQADGDNRVKFIQDLLAEWLGVNDARMMSVYLEKVVIAKGETPHVIVVLKQTDKEYSATGILNDALAALEFEQMDYSDIENELIAIEPMECREFDLGDEENEADCLEE
jgi:GrpB-like predicted nucleotidyltransferase (UPF0157 family)